MSTIPLPERSPSPVSPLPALLTTLVGRDRETASVAALLHRQDVRLLTLTGPGGVGKTRLALRVAAESVENFPDGTAFVGLAPVDDPGLVASAIARALGVRETPDQDVVATLREHLRDLRLLLLLDNFEHLVSAAPLVNQLLLAAPGVTALVTSRSPLRLSGEHEFSVPPLTLPDAAPIRRPTLTELEREEAVALYVERARAVRPDFVLSDNNASAVTEICRRLDGLPLAIELAAARINVLPPAALLTRLEHLLPLLSGGPRDVPARQQTLHDAIAWSYDLLGPADQALFRRLAVFAGGWTVEAADAVARAMEPVAQDVFDGIASLVDTSLVRQPDPDAAEPRFDMLETIREFGHEALTAAGEVEATRNAHAAYFLGLAEDADAQLRGPDQAAWLDRLNAEHDNLRAALAWSIEQGEAGAERALRLSAALWTFWVRLGYLREGRDWLEQAVDRGGVVPPFVRARALGYLGNIAFDLDDHAEAEACYESSLALWRELGELRGVASSLVGLGMTACSRGDYTRARTLHEESLAIRSAMGDREGVALALHSLGHVAKAEGDYAEAQRRYEEALAIWRDLGATSSIGYSYLELARVALYQDRSTAASDLAEQSLTIFRNVGDKPGIDSALHELGRAAHRRGDDQQAAARFGESLALRQELGYKQGIAESLEGLAGVASAVGHPERGARLLAAATAWRASANMPLVLGDRAMCERDLVLARSKLGEAAFRAAQTTGEHMTLADALAEALPGMLAAASAGGSSTAPRRTARAGANRARWPLCARTRGASPRCRGAV